MFQYGFKHEKEMNRLGWHISETGGGCKAYFKELPGPNSEKGWYWMLTVHNDAYVPEKRDDKVIVGLYNENSPYYGEPITEIGCRFSDVLDKKIEFDKE